MSHGLLLWLENIDRRRNEVVPIDPIQDSDTLHEHHKTLTVAVYQWRCYLSNSCLNIYNSWLSISTANPPRAAGLPAQSRFTSGHVPAVAGQLSGQRLPGGQGEGSRYRQPPETAAERSNPRSQRAGQDPGHHQQSAGRLLDKWLEVNFRCCLNMLFVLSLVRICHLGLLLMTWTHLAPSVPYPDGVLRVGDDR